MPKNIRPKSQAKNKTLFLQYPFFTIFSTLKASRKQMYNI